MSAARDGRSAGDISPRVEEIREVFRYIAAFRGSVFVLKIDYPVIHHEGLSALARDLVGMHESGVRLAVVAGARRKIDEVLSRYGVSTRMIGHVRISTPEALPFIKMAAFDAATQLLTAFTGHGAGAVVGNWVRARTLGVRDGVDYGHTGTVSGIRTEELGRIMSEGVIPVFPCIGWSARGEPYNVSSNELAAAAAGALHAAKLFYLTGADRADVNELPSTLTVPEARKLMERRAADLSSEAQELLRLSVGACSSGVSRVHVVNGCRDGAVLEEVFSAAGGGTMVYADDYERIRAMQPADIPDVLRVMEQWISMGALVERSAEDLERSPADFFVFDVDGAIHGCGGIHAYGDAAEITGVAVDPRYRESGVGRRIVEYLIREARARGHRSVFLLTTQSYDWFHQLAFEPADLERLPEERRRTYDFARNSRVMFLELS